MPVKNTLLLAVMLALAPPLARPQEAAEPLPVELPSSDVVPTQTLPVEPAPTDEAPADAPIVDAPTADTAAADSTPATAPVAPAVSVDSVELTLGMHVTADKRIAVPMTTFRPEDTISLCITTRVPVGRLRSGTIGVWWSYGEGETLQSVKSDLAEVFLEGEGRTVFTVENPRTWPPGLYHVEVFLDGEPMAKRDFTVR
jgi:hypothetical protein